MFSQDYELGEEGSDNEPERIQEDDYDSSDDDMKRALRHIGGLDARNRDLEDEESDQDDFEQSMETQLQQTIAGIENKRQGTQDKLTPSSTSQQQELMDLFRSSLATASSKLPSEPISSSSKYSKAGPAKPHEEEISFETSSKKSVKFSAAKPKFYDDAYFDSEDEGMVEDENSTESIEAPASSGKKGKKKPHPVVSNADLFYDPHLDGEDQAWVDSQRRQRSMPSSQPRSDVRDDNKDEDHKGKKSSKNQSSKDGNEEEGMQTDAVLNCPCCMISICDDCQRHEIYKQQYRAMFVINCYPDLTKTLAYKKPKNNTAKKGEPEESSGDPGNLFCPVRCKECQTELGVYDQEEVYHFFNVIASHP